MPDCQAATPREHWRRALNHFGAGEIMQIKSVTIEKPENTNFILGYPLPSSKCRIIDAI